MNLRLNNGTLMEGECRPEPGRRFRYDTPAEDIAAVKRFLREHPGKYTAGEIARDIRVSEGGGRPLSVLLKNDPDVQSEGMGRSKRYCFVSP